jgi:hypothetical protein
MFLLAKYNTQTAFSFAMVKRGVVDLATASDWTPATGDVKQTKDQGTLTNTTNLPSSGGGSVLWALTCTAAELSCAELMVQIVDSATKAVEDNVIRIYTYGNASAKFPCDFSDLVRMGLTALPNANAAASGGLPTVDSTNSVKIQTVNKKNTALSNYEFPMFLSNTNTPATGKTVTVQRSIDGGAYGVGTLSASGVATEVTLGTYKIDFAAGDRNGNVIKCVANATGCDQTEFTFLMEP